MSDAEDPIGACRATAIPGASRPARLLRSGEPTERIGARWQAAAAGDAAFTALLPSPTRLDALHRMLDHAAIAHNVPASPSDYAAMFDRAVAVSPAASVALYSLGDEDALARSTAEIVDWLDGEELLGPDRDILDLGCGLGRVALALATRCRNLLGLDVSAGMVIEAARRGAQAPHLRFAVTEGVDLAALGDRSFDLVLAVDSFPYLVASGHAERHVADARRVLRRGGALAILNLSYGGDVDVDRATARDWAARHGFDPRQLGVTPFRSWDGQAFILRIA